jgi:hypothetical protein
MIYQIPINSFIIQEIEGGNVLKRLSHKFKTINERIYPIESGIFVI